MRFLFLCWFYNYFKIIIFILSFIRVQMQKIKMRQKFSNGDKVLAREACPKRV